LFIVDKVGLRLIASVAERRHSRHIDSHRGKKLLQDTTDHTVIEEEVGRDTARLLLRVTLAESVECFPHFFKILHTFWLKDIINNITITIKETRSF